METSIWFESILTLLKQQVGKHYDLYRANIELAWTGESIEKCYLGLQPKVK